jgi:hypothetical protein
MDNSKVGLDTAGKSKLRRHYRRNPGYRPNWTIQKQGGGDDRPLVRIARGDSSWMESRPYSPQFDVAFRSVMQRVTREIRRHLHLKLCPPMRHVAYQQIRTAPNIQTQPLARFQHHRLGSQTKPQRHWLISDLRLRNVHVDSNLRSRAPFGVDLPQCGPYGPQRQRVIHARSIDPSDPCHHMRIHLAAAKLEVRSNRS